MSTTAKYKADYAISRLIRYNGKRQTFFDGLHKLTLFTNAVLGSSAFVTIISNQPTVAAWLTAIIAIVSAADNVVGFSERARLHQELRSRYYDLYCAIVAVSDDAFNEEAFRERRLRIERDTPPTRRVLDVVSRNEEDIARGWSFSETQYVSPLRYLLRHIYDLPPKNWKTISDHKNRSRWFKRNSAI